MLIINRIIAIKCYTIFLSKNIVKQIVGGGEEKSDNTDKRILLHV